MQKLCLVCVLTRLLILLLEVGVRATKKVAELARKAVTAARQALLSSRPRALENVQLSSFRLFIGRARERVQPGAKVRGIGRDEHRGRAEAKHFADRR